jgi:predicted membrane channel-forming protein YqfA (hemolysin III family)
MEVPRRIKKTWQIGVIVSISLGVLAIIPALISRQAFWPWVPFTSVILWIIGVVIYGVGRRLTGRPLREPRIR